MKHRSRVTHGSAWVGDMVRWAVRKVRTFRGGSGDAHRKRPVGSTIKGGSHWGKRQREGWKSDPDTVDLEGKFQ